MLGETELGPMIGQETVKRINALGERRQEIQRELQDTMMYGEHRRRLVWELRQCESGTEQLYGDLRRERSYAGRPVGAVVVAEKRLTIVPMQGKRPGRKARLQW